MADAALFGAKMLALLPGAPLHRPSLAERSAAGLYRLPARRQDGRGRVSKGFLNSSVAAAASAALANAEAVLSSVEELPDGSIVLHYATDGKTREVSRDVYAFLTRTSRSSRQVSSEVLQQLLGENVQVHMHLPHPASGIASFVKGVLQAEQSGTSVGLAAQEESIAAQPRAIENEQAAADMPPLGSGAQGADSMSSGPLAAGGTTAPAGFDFGRLLAVLSVSGLATAAARVGAASSQVGQSLVGKRPLLVTGAAFAVVAVLLWIVGFGRSNHLKSKIPMST